MKFNINQINESVKEIEVKLTYDEIKDELFKEIKKRTQKLQIDGFRRGKIPQHIIKKIFGNVLENEASEKVANTFFWDIVEKEKIRVLDRPKMTALEFINGEKLDFKIEFETFPTLDVKEYSDIEIDVPYYQATDSEVEHEIKHILEANRQFEPVDEVGLDRNYIIDAELIRTDEEGNELDNFKPENISIDLSKNNVHPDIIENCKSKRIGESFRFQYFDENQENDSESQSSEDEKFYYKVIILGIEKIITPELNEELIKKITKDRISNPEDFKQEIKDNIQKFYDQKFDEVVKLKLMSEIVKRNDFTPPNSLVNNLLEEYLKKEKEYYDKKRMYFNREEAANRFRKIAENDFKWFLIKDEIIKKENISITEEEIEERAKMESEKTGLPVKKLVNYYKSANQLDSLLEKKLFEFLSVRNKINKVNPENYYKKEESNEK